MKVAVGMVFGRLTVKRLVSKRSLWECACECGSTVIHRGNLLTSGRVKSCGCYRREILSRSNLQHGASYTREFSIWKEIHKRCKNDRCPAYKNYGGRGIRVCDRWSLFSNFLQDMGPAPDGYSIDRINNDGNYDAENCRWASRKTQNRNTRRSVVVEFGGQKMSLAEACEIAGAPYNRVRDRIVELGWSSERALTEPSKRACHDHI